MKYSRIIFGLLVGILLLIAGCGSKEKRIDSEPTSKEGNSLDSIEGVWEGTINIPNQPLPIIVTFQDTGGTISIPVQGLKDYVLTRVELTEPKLFFDMEIQGQTITFDGKVEQEKITGTFTQQGQSFPFELGRGHEETAIEEGDFVQVKLKDGTMDGQVEIPEGEGPFPVAIIIAGSGPTDKDGNSMLLPGKNNSLKMLAENLAAKGVASIRYDKRGVGKNSGLAGNEEDLRFTHYIEDAAAWVQFAKEDKLFSDVGIMGHSEGSLIGMVAAEQAEADFFISIAGAGRPIDQVLLEQLEAQLPDNLLNEAKAIIGKLKQGEEVKTVSPELQSVFRPSVQPYMISWLVLDPQQQLAKLDSPVLIINGTRDLQVTIGDAKLLHNAKEGSELVIVENMNHIFKEAPEDPEGNMATYSNPDLPLAAGLMERIFEFMQK